MQLPKLHDAAVPCMYYIHYMQELYAVSLQ
jgi:hypothetical protein